MARPAMGGYYCYRCACVQPEAMAMLLCASVAAAQGFRAAAAAAAAAARVSSAECVIVLHGWLLGLLLCKIME